MKSGLSTVGRPLADRAMRLFMRRRPDASPGETAMYARVVLYALLSGAAAAFYGVGFATLDRATAAVISGAMALASFASAAIGLRTTEVGGLRRVAHVVIGIQLLGLLGISVIAGELGELTVWFMSLCAAAAIFLLGDVAALVWCAVVAAAMVVSPVVRVGDPGPEYVPAPWEYPVSQIGFAIVMVGYALVTRRATEAHLDTLAAHDAEALRHTRRLQESLQEQARIQDELERARDEAQDALRTAERARAVTEHARRLAEEANLAKSRFLANMSHELRTPLNAVIGYAELIAEEAEDAEQGAIAEDVLRIRAAGRHLLNLINDLLDLAKVESGRADLQLTDVEVSELVVAVSDTVRPIAAANRNCLEVELGPRTGVMHTDRTRLLQVLVNVVSNACKFTSGGRVDFVVTADGDDVTFVVRDTGIGMTADQMARVFEPFRQADPSTTRRFGGTGLGLAIARTYTELLGGEIRTESDVGVGTTFTLRVPRRSSPRSLIVSGDGAAIVVDAADAVRAAVGGGEHSDGSAHATAIAELAAATARAWGGDGASDGAPDGASGGDDVGP